MRRIRHLDHCDYIVPIGQKTGQVLALSNQSNVLLERTWHRDSRPEFELKLHAKFNVDTMNGIQIMARLHRNGILSQSLVSAFSLYKVNPANWTETFVSSVAASQASPGIFSGSIVQATLGSNEVSGGECYAVECQATRRRQKYLAKVWFNHLGCFDSLIRLRHSVELLESMKVDE